MGVVALNQLPCFSFPPACLSCRTAHAGGQCRHSRVKGDGAIHRCTQVLHVRGALSRAGEHCAFNSMPLSGLHNLTHLRLERFTHFRLGCLPASLRTLR